MIEELIKFETAKLAKEKGFSVHFNMLIGIEDCENPEDYLYELPTQSLLQKWLREEHGIYVRVDTVNVDHHYAWIIKLDPEHLSYTKSDTTYEKALEIGLTEALKLITNEKDNL